MKTFGFVKADNIGKLAYPATQMAPALCSSFQKIFGLNQKYPCLIPCAIDQDPFFRLIRDIAPRLGFPKPAVIHAQFLPALTGVNSKMSSSEPNSTVFLSDDQTTIKKKILRSAFSGGQETVAQHRELGGNPDIDVPFQYLRFFEPDDIKLEQYYLDYKAGILLSGELKLHLLALINPIVSNFQLVRNSITDTLLQSYMTPRPLRFG